jgi:diguanylate cyclase (GGDEF)-like protein
MVKEADRLPDFGALLVENQRIIADYLLTSGRVAMILLDREGIILDCNSFFLENAGLTEKPLGRSINTFLNEDLPAAGDCRPVRLTFVLNHSLEHSLSGHMLELGGWYVIFAHSIHLTDNEMVANLSRLADELTDLTRKLNKKNRELTSANILITQLMNTDPLTGLFNRRHLRERMDIEMSKARRHSRSLSALMADIDHFKSINDTYGHDAGDRVLVQVARTITESCRKEDIVARFGGEEFVVILPDSAATAALECAERIRKSIEHSAFEGIRCPVTASLGATCFVASDTEDSLIKRADTALYQAKTAGRNRVVLHEPQLPETHEPA